MTRRRTSPPTGSTTRASISSTPKKDPKEAVKKFEEVDRQHPYSEWARKSLIMTSYAYYQAGEYDDCVNSAKRYITLHPGGADAAYAQFLIGSSYFDEIPDITRDQARTEKALAALDEVIRKYPASEYANSAKQKIEVARDQLAGKEMEIGRYYLKKKDYTGAINRFKVVVTKYQTTRHVEEALMRLTESYMALGIVDEAQTAAAVLGHNFPDSYLVQARLRAGEDRRRRAEREPGLLDQQGVQEARAGLSPVIGVTYPQCRWPALCRPSASLMMRICKAWIPVRGRA